MADMQRPLDGKRMIYGGFAPVLSACPPPFGGRGTAQRWRGCVGNPALFH